MIKNILLDLDDTILDFKAAERIAIRSTLLELGLSPTEEICKRYSEINRMHWQMLERGEISRPEVQRRRFCVLFSEYGISISGDEGQRVYAKYLSEGADFIDGAEELLEYLYGKYDLYIASNGNLPIQRPRIEKSGIGRYFKKIFVSEELGFDKPRAEYFDECFKRMDCPDRDKTIIIGDSLTSDIKGGINAGILTCHLDPTGENNREDIVPDFKVRALSEIPKLLDVL